MFGDRPVKERQILQHIPNQFLFKNRIINGDFRVNQRGFDGNWANKAIGEYGYDRWKKYSDTEITQIIEEGFFKPDTIHTVSYDYQGERVIFQTRSPSTGHWGIVVPIGATKVQVEEGTKATDFEYVPFDLELLRCQRYYEKTYDINTAPGTPVGNRSGLHLNVGSSNSAAESKTLTWFYKVRKRALPTIALYSPTTGTSGMCLAYSPTSGETEVPVMAASMNEYFSYVYSNTTTVSHYWFFVHATADAEL